MVRTAMVVYSHYPADNRVRREAEAIVDKGMSVDVICPIFDKQCKQETVNGVNIYRVGNFKRRGSKLSYIFEYGYFIAMAFYKLMILHIRKKYKIVHVHNLPDILVLSALFPKLTGAKVILDMHEIMPEFFMRKYKKSENDKSIKLLKYQEKMASRFSDHVIVATPFLKETVSRRSTDAGTCTTILNLSDSKYFNGRPNNNTRPNNKFRLIYPGTISELHGVDIAINAIDLIVKKTGIPIEFNIYGSGPQHEKNRLISQIERLYLNESVKMHKQVFVDEFADVLRTMDAGVVPKRGGTFAEDAISSKLFDFASVGLPSIVSHTRGDSLYFDESMVLFFEPGNVEQLADCIIKLYNSEELRRSLSENSKKLSKKVNWEMMKEDLYAIYDKLISGP
jgi:glycosyltransferase involved in cell wall biosynthesis